MTSHDAIAKIKPGSIRAQFGRFRLGRVTLVDLGCELGEPARRARMRGLDGMHMSATALFLDEIAHLAVARHTIQTRRAVRMQPLGLVPALPRPGRGGDDIGACAWHFLNGYRAG
jgi:hypothetical protein